ncbi:MAG: hypothetical protein FWF35_04225 [Elusimicrobia bacterium]|nr:hypothetical protein [Elusimicrobiota bacterium]
MITINGKQLPIPSFFMISNLGGGASDKYREVVYMDLYKNIPTLFNYYYLTRPDFATKWLKHLPDYDSMAKFIKYVRQDMINTDKYISKSHSPSDVDYESIVYLLDSGAANIINKFDKNASIEQVKEHLLKELINYYDFAHRYKFDLIVGLDIGGKYTFKGEERHTQEIIDRNTQIKKQNDEINSMLLEASIKYLTAHKDYYPKVLATVHGDTPKEFREYTEKILALEKEYNYKFWGFALGGVANAKGKDKSWFKSMPEGMSANTFLTAEAAKIVKKTAGNRYIHVLGGGGKDNIPLISSQGAASFDTFTPGRRAYDGNDASTKLVFNKDADEHFSKYLIGKYDINLKPINKDWDFDYYPLNKINDDIDLCGCPACQCIKAFGEIKKLYSLRREEDNEDYYYARQLCNAHSIWQHVRLCEIASRKKFLNYCLTFSLLIISFL